MSEPEKGNGEKGAELTAEELAARHERFTELCKGAFGYSPLDHTCILSQMANRCIAEGGLKSLTPEQALVLVVVQGVAPFWIRQMAQNLGNPPNGGQFASGCMAQQRDMILDLMLKKHKIIGVQLQPGAQRNELGLAEN